MFSRSTPASRSLLLGAALLSLLPLSCLRAQMQPHSRHEGELLPVLACETDDLIVVKNGKKHRASFRDFENKPADRFGTGSVEISRVVADLDPASSQTAKQASGPGAVRFRYSAEITSTEALPNCYALLVFTANGSIGTSFLKIGRLEAGKPRQVSVDLFSRVDAIGRLHVFSQTLELRSNQVTEAYDINAYYKALAAQFRGVPAMDLCKSEHAYEHVLSKDGRLLATTRDRDTHDSIIVYDLVAMKLLCDVPVGESTDSITDITWISDNEVAFLSDRQVWLLDVAKKAVQPLKKEVSSILAALPHEPQVLVLLREEWGEGTWTAKFNVHTRKTYDIEDLDIGWSIFDDQGNARIRFVVAGAGRKFFYRPTPEARWRPMDEAVKQEGLRFSLKGSELLDRKVDLHSIGPDGDTLYLSTRMDSDLFQLAAFSMSEGRITRVIAKHPRYDLNTGDEGYSRLLFRKGTSELLGLIYEGAKYQVIWWDPVYTRVQKAMDEQFPEHTNMPVDWSENGDSFIYFSFSDRDPGVYYIFRPGTGTLVPLLSQGDRLKERTLATTQAISFTARDGAKIPAYVTWPPGLENSPAPLIVRIHGGPTVRDSWRFDAMNQFLATRGYIVLQVNYRGSSGYGAAFQAAGLRARLDTVVLDDIADGARHLIDTGKADATRVGVMGGSFGGWATYMSLIKYPELYRAGVAMAAISHWKAALRNSRTLFGNRIGHSFWKALLDREDFDEQEKFIDPLLRAAELKQPIYIMHGELDYVVHATESKTMVEALRKTNTQVQSMSFPFSGHGTSSLIDRVTELNEVGAFFEKHLAKATTAGSGSDSPP